MELYELGIQPSTGFSTKLLSKYNILSLIRDSRNCDLNIDYWECEGYHTYSVVDVRSDDGDQIVFTAAEQGEFYLCSINLEYIYITNKGFALISPIYSGLYV